MILFDDVVEVLDLPQFTGFWDGPLILELLERFGIRRVFVDCDDPRSGGMRLCWLCGTSVCKKAL
jgi:hypothetical protein